ncbi:MAG: F0F1 ATP synthase subunit delta [Candidatus Berkelbacteria bacterium]
MKISAKIYAQTLIQSATEDNLKKLAKSFWYKLQKNKQYKDMSKVLEAIDEESARLDNKILAKIYSKNEISQTEKQAINEKLKNKFKKEIILQNIIGKNITGIIVKVEDKIIDLSLEGKLDKLKRVLN